MSKESRPHDRWDQVITASADRPTPWCRGCGYYPAANGHCRADCTAECCIGASLPATPARHLRLAPNDPAEILTAETLAVCAEIDVKLGNPPGTAARGCWFWHWPPHPAQTVETLAALHADAVAFLHKLTNREDLP